MKQTLLAMIVLTLAFALPQSARAEVHFSVQFSLPAPVVFEAPPEVIVLPDTNAVYVVPDVEFDLFFWNGYWWRPWEGRWYRSRYYNRDWGYYSRVPSFYYDVDPGWRDYYRERTWSGHRWNYERIPNQRLRSNWKQWHSSQYWQSNRTWGVESYQPRPRQQIEQIRYQRQEQYLQRPEVQIYHQQIQELQRQPQPKRQQQVQEPQRQPRQQQQVREPSRHPQTEKYQQERQAPQQKSQPKRQQQVREPKPQPQHQEHRQQVQEQKQQKQPADKAKRQKPPKEDDQGQSGQHQGKPDQQHGKDKKHDK